MALSVILVNGSMRNTNREIPNIGAAPYKVTLFQNNTITSFFY